MSGRVFRNFGFKSLIPPHASTHRVRLPKPPSRQFSTAWSPTETLNTTISSSGGQSSGSTSKDKDVRIRDFLESISWESGQTGRWHAYNDLLTAMEADTVPLEVHQLALRKCVPPAALLRLQSARRHRTVLYPHNPHEYEARLQAVMYNIRLAGWIPDIEDYHFVLQQFAAVGHYVGSQRIIAEMSSFGVQPTAVTYGWILQALAHRLSLPSRRGEEQRTARTIAAVCREVIQEMQEKDIPVTSENMDLALRTLKETCREEDFDQLLKSVYGVDLSFPDSQPLEAQSGDTSTLQSEQPDQTSAFLPLTTPALNTIITSLGRQRRISKMVVAFEVLTQPLLPSRRSPLSSFDDEEDEDKFYPTPPDPLPSHPVPSAPPNSTTFNYLIFHTARSGHAHLARHYLLYALEQERILDRRLRGDVSRLPLAEIPAPHMAVNRRTVIPVFGRANRYKSVELMRFARKVVERALRRKNAGIAFYTQWRDKLAEEQNGSNVSAIPSEDLAPAGVPLARDSSNTIFKQDTTLTVPSAHADKSSLSPSLSVDDAAVSTPPSASPLKTFDINLHISILRRDKAGLEDLLSRINFVLARTVQRVKERLGRRVWTGKNVYLAGDGGRVARSRSAWRQSVVFREYNPTEKPPEPSRFGLREVPLPVKA